MAIITISREVAAFGDEVAEELAKQLNYKFVKRTDIEKRIIELGFPQEKMPKYDERKPGFFASLAKDRDEYINYLQYAILEAAAQENVIIIGRGAFIVLQNVPNNISIRLISPEAIRLQRLEKEFSWDEKQAKQRIQESDMNRDGFHKSFYNVDLKDSSYFHLVLNTGLIDVPTSAKIISSVVSSSVDEKKETEGKKIIENMLKSQEIVNKLIFKYKLNIEFIHGVIEDNTFILQGISDSIVAVENAIRIIKQELPNYEVKSSVGIVHDFKTLQ